MVCIYCGKDTEVYNSRTRTRNPSVWRRRRCQSCVAQFTTIEAPELASSIVVRQNPINLIPFNRDKLFLSLYNALAHREDSIGSATSITETIIGRLLKPKLAQDGILDLTTITKTCYQTLKRFDPLAAHTYRAYHQRLLRD